MKLFLVKIQAIQLEDIFYLRILMANIKQHLVGNKKSGKKTIDFF